MNTPPSKCFHNGIILIVICFYRAQNEMYMGGDRKKREKVCRSKGCV